VTYIVRSAYRGFCTETYAEQADAARDSATNVPCNAASLQKVKTDRTNCMACSSNNNDNYNDKNNSNNDNSNNNNSNNNSNNHNNNKHSSISPASALLRAFLLFVEWCH
ncbi:unnamed protein product, partial [Polarella glacialis]